MLTTIPIRFWLLKVALQIGNILIAPLILILGLHSQLPGMAKNGEAFTLLSQLEWEIK